MEPGRPTATLLIPMIGLVSAALVVLLGIFVVPVRVSFGAGSIRCGSAVSPYEGEGLSHPCRDAAESRLRETAVAAGAFIASAVVVGLLLTRKPPAHPLALAAVLTTGWLLALGITTALFAGSYAASNV